MRPRGGRAIGTAPPPALWPRACDDAHAELALVTARCDACMRTLEGDRADELAEGAPYALLTLERLRGLVEMLLPAVDALERATRRAMDGAAGGPRARL